jgi:hypothetical protein
MTHRNVVGLFFSAPVWRFNIFTDKILSRLEEANTHPSVIRKRQVAGLFFVSDLAAGVITRIGLQRAISCIKNVCEEWNLKIHVAKTKIVVFKKVQKLSKDEKWWLGRKEIEVVKEIKFLDVVMDSRGKWETERKQVAIKGKAAENSINICASWALNIEVIILEQLYNSLIELHMMTEVEIWG